MAEWINKNNAQFHNEIYRPNRKYDVVVFSKMMDIKCREEVKRIKAYGGKVIFDANVNYYEIWGDYFVQGTRPTAEQQANAIWMTENSDWVIADSSYIESIVRKYTDKVSCIPDNVNLDIYKNRRTHSAVDTVTIVWSGVAKKAQHVLAIKEVLTKISQTLNVRLLFVSDCKPSIFDELSGDVKCEYKKFTDDSDYSKILSECDIIISPKILCNGYELGHTEYKITLGMAACLPAVASPQQSYMEAVSYYGGGIIAESDDEWYGALHSLISDVNLRIEMGNKAYKTVDEKYCTPVIANRFIELFNALCR